MALSIAKIIAIVVLIAAIDLQPKAYYVFVRCVVTAVCLWSAYAALKVNKSAAWCAALGFFAVIYNPVFRFRFGRENWPSIDIICLCVLCLSFYLHRPPKPRSAS